MSKEEDKIPCPLPLPVSSFNHVSLVCKSVTISTEFYENVLGFQLVKRPSNSFDFVGAWLFNYGVGIHLLQCKSLDDLPKKTEINPRDNHISFQCPDLFLAENRLQEMGIKYKKRIVEDEGLHVDQLFFHDPDGYMIEICNCENLPVIPVRSTTDLGYALPQSNTKVKRQESHSEIALVPLNVATVQLESPPSLRLHSPGLPISILKGEKKIEATGSKNCYLSNALDDKNPFFLNIMDFYL